MLSIAETVIDVNEASSSGKGFSLFLLRVLSLPSRPKEIIRPSIAIVMSLPDVSDGTTLVIFTPFEVTD